MEEGLRTPVLFVIFNRPETTFRVFEKIREAKPHFLFIAADGPRENIVSDEINCKTVRLIVEKVDWECEIKTLFRESNLGCRNAVSAGINWFFENVEEGIVLEDDCLPHPDFFLFCETMLERYRDHGQVMHISGDNFQFGKKRGAGSYYFSGISHIWGWASWRRAWNSYDVNMKDYPSFLIKDEKKSVFHSPEEKKYWLFFFDRVFKKANTWDYQWTYAVMKQRGLCIIPNVNLISNIGFGQQATHAEKKSDPVANMPTKALGPIIHPEHVAIDHDADYYTITQAFPIPSFATRAFRKIIKIISGK